MNNFWNLGERIRRLRKKRGMTLKELAEASEISVSFLSDVERGRSQASMGSLRKISQALGVSLLSLESPHDESSESGEDYQHKSLPVHFRPISDVTVVKSDRRKKLAYPNQTGFYELVTPDLNRNLEVLFFRMEPGFQSGPRPIVDPPGEKCLLILAGCLDFTIKGSTHRLEKGDSVSYPANLPLSFQVVGDEAVECIIVITPPGF